MNKQPDFGDDLATLNDSVTASVGDVLEALQHKRSASKPPPVQPKEQATPAASESPDEAAASDPPPAPRRQRSANRARLSPEVERNEPLENVTTRLRQRTNELLTEAALRQRLKKEIPATRQDIIEAALGDWLRRHGYARIRDEDAAD